MVGVTPLGVEPTGACTSARGCHVAQAGSAPSRIGCEPEGRSACASREDEGDRGRHAQRCSPSCRSKFCDVGCGGDNPLLQSHDAGSSGCTSHHRKRQRLCSHDSDVHCFRPQRPGADREAEDCLGSVQAAAAAVSPAIAATAAASFSGGFLPLSYGLQQQQHQHHHHHQQQQQQQQQCILQSLGASFVKAITEGRLGLAKTSCRHNLTDSWTLSETESLPETKPLSSEIESLTSQRQRSRARHQTHLVPQFPPLPHRLPASQQPCPLSPFPWSPRAAGACRRHSGALPSPPSSSPVHLLMLPVLLLLLVGQALSTAAVQALHFPRRSLDAISYTPSPPLCPALKCNGTQQPNSAISESSSPGDGGTCECSSPLIVALALSGDSLPAVDDSVSTSIRNSVASALKLDASQVWLASAVGSAPSQQNATLWIFRTDDLDWATVDTSVMVDAFLSNASITGLPGVTSGLVSATLGSATPVPPTGDSIYFPPGAPTVSIRPPPSPPSPPAPPPPGTPAPDSGIGWWVWVLVVLGVMVALALLAVIYLLWLRQRTMKQHKEEKETEEGTAVEDGSAISNTKTLSRRANSTTSGVSTFGTSAVSTFGTSSRSKIPTSDFNLKVAENFVKAMTLEELQDATNNFAESNALGSGGYGTVYKGVGPNGVLWAVKRAKNASEEGIEDFQNEVDVISKMSHRNLVKLLGYCDDRGEQILVYEFVPNGTLRQHIRPDNPNFAPLTFQQRLEIAVGSAEGLKYLHSAAEPAIIHRDIKCDNILLDADMQAKVADFGVFKKSTTTEPGKTMNTRVVGTPGYVDPEYYQTYKVTVKSDVYSFGVVLLELITGRPPIMEDPSVENESYMVTLSRWATPKIAAGKVETIVDPRLHGNYPRQALNMMAAITAMCVRRLGRDRPEMAEVATRLAEIKYFLKPSSGILEPVMNLFPEDRDEADNLMDIPEEEDDDQVPEFIPGTAHGINPYSSTDIAAPVSMVFSDR